MAVKTDLIRGASYTEEAGEGIDATETQVVTVDLSDPQISRIPPEITRLALAGSGVRQPGDRWSTADNNLIVTGRSATIVGIEDNEATVEVEVKYRIIRKYASPPLRGGSSLAQVERSTDWAGNDITVTHNGDTQTGRVSAMLPTSNFVVERTVSTNDPTSVVRSWTGKVNGDHWHGETASMWMIVRADFTPVDMGSNPRKYLFEVEFERAQTRDGWQPSVAYVDPELKEIPEDLEEGVGIKSVYIYEAATFGSGDLGFEE